MEINLSNYDNKDIIKILREWTELTQKEFAESIGLKERTIRRYEAVDTIYNINTLRKISKFHKIKIIFEKK